MRIEIVLTPIHGERYGDETQAAFGVQDCAPDLFNAVGSANTKSHLELAAYAQSISPQGEPPFKAK